MSFFSISFSNCKKRKENGRNGYWVNFESPSKITHFGNLYSTFIYSSLPVFFFFTFPCVWVECFLIYIIELDAFCRFWVVWCATVQHLKILTRTTSERETWDAAATVSVIILLCFKQCKKREECIILSCDKNIKCILSIGSFVCFLIYLHLHAKNTKVTLIMRSAVCNIVLFIFCSRKINTLFCPLIILIFKRTFLMYIAFIEY